MYINHAKYFSIFPPTNCRKRLLNVKTHEEQIELEYPWSQVFRYIFLFFNATKIPQKIVAIKQKFSIGLYPMILSDLKESYPDKTPVLRIVNPWNYFLILLLIITIINFLCRKLVYLSVLWELQSNDHHELFWVHEAKKKTPTGWRTCFPSIVFYMYRKRSHYCRRGGTWWHHQQKENLRENNCLCYGMSQDIWLAAYCSVKQLMLNLVTDGLWTFISYIYEGHPSLSSIPGKGLYTNWFIIALKWILLWCIWTQPLNSGFFYFAFIFLFIYNLLLQKDFPKQVILQKDLNWVD